MKNKFTLIELLVVVAILGILVTLLLPSLTKAREISKRAVCLSQQKQLYLGTALYGKNNNEYLPRGYRYGGQPNNYNDQGINSLSEEIYLDLRDNYMGGVNNNMFKCVNIDGYFRYESSWKSYRIGYSYTGDRPSLNQNFNYEFPTRVTDNNRVVLWGEANIWASSWNLTIAPHTSGGGIQKWPDGGMSAQSIGAQGGNYTFLDGGGKWHSKNKLETYEFFANGGLSGLLPSNMW